MLAFVDDREEHDYLVNEVLNPKDDTLEVPPIFGATCYAITLLTRHLNVKAKIHSDGVKYYDMADQLKLLSTYMTFSLIKLPSNYLQFLQQYYKLKCKTCGKQIKEILVCLLYSKVVPPVMGCCPNKQQKYVNEGGLTRHARE